MSLSEQADSQMKMFWPRNSAQRNGLLRSINVNSPCRCRAPAISPFSFLLVVLPIKKNPQCSFREADEGVNLHVGCYGSAAFFNAFDDEVEANRMTTSDIKRRRRRRSRNSFPVICCAQLISLLPIPVVLLFTYAARRGRWI